MNNKDLTIYIGLCFGIILLVGVFWYFYYHKGTETKVDPETSELGKYYLMDDIRYDSLKGDAQKKIIIEEYISLTCGACFSFHNSVLPILIRDYVDTGKVVIIIKDYPLNSNAYFAAIIGRATNDQEKRKKYVEEVMKRIDTWNRSAKDAHEALKKIAISVGYDSAEIDKALDPEIYKKMHAKLRDDVYQAREEKIYGTPSLVINGKLYEGPISYHSIKTFIDRKIDAVNNEKK